MPTPAIMTVSKASEHDLPVAKNMLYDAMNIRIFGDSAFVFLSTEISATQYK